jgi:hypothetical protein
MDQQWLVRAAAAQVQEDLTQRNKVIPNPRPALTEATWLLNFASNRGFGVAPGKASLSLLFRLLDEGELDQKLAALNYLIYRPILEAVPKILSMYHDPTSNLEIKQAAYETLWFYESSGWELRTTEESMLSQ